MGRQPLQALSAARWPEILGLDPQLRVERVGTPVVGVLDMDELEDVGRVRKDPIARYQDRRRVTATGLLHGPAVQEWRMPLLAILKPRVIQRPPRLLTVVARRDGDEEVLRVHQSRVPRPGWRLNGCRTQE